MDFYQELLITALLSVLLAFLLGTLFSVSDAESDRPDTADGREPAREAKSQSSGTEIGVGTIGCESTGGDGGGGCVREECEGDGEVEMVEIRSGLVGMEKVDDGLLGEEERFLGLARMGGEGLLGAEERTDASASGRTGVESVGEEDIEIQVNETKGMLETHLALEEEERSEQIMEKRSQVYAVEGPTTEGKMVKDDEESFHNFRIVEEKSVGSTEKEIVDVKASQVGLETGGGETKELLEVPHDSDLLGEGKCLLEEEEKSEQASSLGSNMGTENISQMSEVQGTTTKGDLVKDEERENLGIAKGENVRPTEEVVVDLEARWVGLEREEVREAEEILEVPRDSHLLGEGKGLLEEEEERTETEQASPRVGGNLVNDDEGRLENLGIAEEKNVRSTKGGVVLEEGSEIEAEKETAGVVDKGKEQSFLNEEDEWEGIEKTEVEKLFSQATAYIGSESGGDELSKLSGDDQLQLYGLYKVATEGPCYDSQPMALKVSARAKWNAWQKLGHMNPEGAMEQYMNLLSEKIPGWKGEKPEGDNEPEESYSAEEAPSGTTILSTSLNLYSHLDSETKRAPEGPSCSDKDN